MEPKTLKTLRIFFTTADAAFTLVENIQKIMDHEFQPSVLHLYTKLALDEVQKEEPDLSYINKILFQMEQIATENGKNKKDSKES